MNYYDETKPYADININEVLDIADDDIEGIESATYEVWALGYDDRGAITEAELLLASFNNPDDAIAYAEKVTLAEVIHRAAEEYCSPYPDYNVTLITIEVETVVDMDEDGTMNVGTIYRKGILTSDDDPIPPANEHYFDEETLNR